ncbi:MAG: hypothetical protein OXH89_02895, partial [bacterium]|nr:hypothetical protein [bacterium]
MPADSAPPFDASEILSRRTHGGGRALTPTDQENAQMMENLEGAPLEYKVRDLGLADQGRREIELAEH